MRPVVPSAVSGTELAYIGLGSNGRPLAGAPVPTAAVGAAHVAALTAARYLQWRYQDDQQLLYAGFGYAPVTVSASGRSAFWQSYGIGAPGRSLQVAYAWPDAASQVWSSLPDKLARQVLRDPTTVRQVATQLSAALSKALANAAVQADRAAR